MSWRLPAAQRRLPIARLSKSLPPLAVAALAGLLSAASPVGALDLGGTARLLWIDSRFDGTSSRSLEQQLTLDLRQELTPYLILSLRHSHFDLENRVGGADPFSRRFRQPELDLLYIRPRLTARLGYEYRLADGSFEPDNFEARGLNGSLFWQARPRLSFNFSFRDEINQADVAALGRDLATLQARGTVLYSREHWSGSYSYSRVELENRTTGIAADQDRHDLRLQAFRNLFDERLALSFSAAVGRFERRERLARGADLAEPVPVVQGLFALDLTPGLGELEPSPGLIDGDVLTPVSPAIAIGGANTFRNIGLDLGITRPLSRLEVSVDRPSGPALVWEIYRSRDNLFWEPVSGVSSEYDADLLRYTLRFPEIQDRFVKAVNVSVNPAVEVRVTELRALRDLSGENLMDRIQADLYRVDLSASYLVSSRVRASLSAGSSNDETTVADLVQRDFQADYANVGLDIDLAASLRLTLAYRLAETEDRRERVLDRDTEETLASLQWTPLETVDVVLAAGTRDETERGQVLQSTRSSRLGVALQLLPELRLVSDFSLNRLEDPFSGTDRDSWLWSQRLEARPADNWLIGGGYDYLRTEIPGSEVLLERTNVHLQTTWTPGSFLTLTGTWRYNEEDIGGSLRQSYGLFYTPGPKLTLTASWEELDSDAGRVTGNQSLGVSYRLYTRVLLSATLSRSRFSQVGGANEDITSAQAGLTLGF